MKNIKKKSTGDYALAASRAGLGAIPFVGAAASELLNLIVTPPLEKRRIEWMEDIGQRLKVLEEKLGIDLSKLSENDTFIDSVLTATQIAIRTSNIEKKTMLRNAITNIIIADTIDESLNSIYFNLIDYLSIWHIRILDFFNDPKLWFDRHYKTYNDQFNQGRLGSILIPLLIEGFPELKDKKEFVNIIWKDLYQNGLVDGASLQVIISSLDSFSSRTTKLGKDFLLFITDRNFDAL